MKTIHITMNSIRRWSFIALLLLIISSCDDDFEKTNTSPNDVTDIDDEYLFANACLQTLRGSHTNLLQYRFATQYAQMYVGQGNFLFIDRYYDNFTTAEYQDLFKFFNYGPIRLIKAAMSMTEPGGDKENPVRYAMNEVVAIANFVQLADAYGAVPYTEGGIGQEGLMYPKFDQVEFIYKDAIEKLGTAITVLSSADAKDGYPQADPFFDNDLNKWVRFANSLRLRYAMRMRFVDEAKSLAEQTIQDCLSKPLIEDNSQNVWYENTDSDIDEFRNPVYEYYKSWAWKMSASLVDKLKSMKDPRLPVFVKPNNDGNYIGTPNGLSDDSLSVWDLSKVSDPSDNLVGRAAPIYFLTAGEVWFLRAEAALYGITSENANNSYQSAIRSSLSLWKIDESEISTYLSSNANATLTGSSERQFEQISTQLWLALVPNGMEAWSNIRRTGYPYIPRRTAPKYDLGVTNGRLPTRLRYPLSEININNANYLKAIEEQGADVITTKLWWDVKD
ncbi:MAG: SusD/RagB family nutrient-binding outer membrane lipoprotein [Bacteroidales bacterium]